MGRRSARKSSAGKFLMTPPSLVATPVRSPSESPENFKSSSSCFTTPAKSSSSLQGDRRSNSNNNKIPAAEQLNATSPVHSTSSLSKTSNSIADLKKMTLSRIDSIKRQIDCSYSDVLKDMEVSHSRLQKRYKAENQACEQTMQEVEKDFKKMIDHMSHTHDAMEASYTNLIAEAQARATRLCKTRIPELSQSVDKAIDALRSHYGVATTST
ncbi:hypothetical protein L1887_27718 [Cichorium endivia]|nr:hypothetical protein L1887_27718 [Cichorium endivia]